MEFIREQLSTPVRESCDAIAVGGGKTIRNDRPSRRWHSRRRAASRANMPCAALADGFAAQMRPSGRRELNQTGALDERIQLC